MSYHSSERAGAGSWWSIVLGLILAAIGAILAAGGAWLAWLGGSLYYFPVGLLLVVAGGLIMARRRTGAWLYVLVWLVTLVWAYWEVGLDGWALVPRVVAPTVLLVPVLLTMPMLRRVLPAGLVILAFGLGNGATGHAQDAPAGAGAAPEATAEAPADPGGDWPAYGGTNAALRYSPLDQLTPENVAGLKPAWTFHTGDMPSGKAVGKYSPEGTPIKVGNALYLCTGMNILISLDPATGKQLWRFDPKVSADAIPYGATCRGVAYYEVPNVAAETACATRILMGTLDARLIALDAKTGKPCADFGNAGTVDLNEGIGFTVPGWYSVTAPPTIVRGIAVVGAQVKDGEAEDAPSGVVRGYDAVTGDLAWAWDMGAPDRTGAPAEGETYTRGTPNMWTVAAGDEGLGLVYLPLGNSAVDYYGGNRKDFENAYSSSLVAIDVTTGKPAWSFQTIHYDLWDYDLGSQVTLVDMPMDGGTVPALILPSKQGQIYVLDRRTGKPLFPVEERPAPTGGVEDPARLAKTQPHSGYAHVDKPELTERDMWGMSPIDQLWCRIQFRRAVYKGEFTPPTVGAPYIEYPGYNGGSDWGSVAVDPERGLLIVNYNDTANFNRLIPREQADREGMKPIYEGGSPASVGEAGAQAGAPYAISVNAGWRVPYTGMLCTRPPYGWIRGIDLKSGETVWEHALGDATENGPFGIPSRLPITIGTPNNGGPLVTGGGLVFVAATTDQKFRAFDAETGEQVWETKLPAGGQTTPMTYEVNGRQYVVIYPGGHHFMETPVGDEVIAYALPES